MVGIEYLGGVPRRTEVKPIAASVHSDTLQLKHGRLFGGWSFQVPLSMVLSVELTNRREIESGTPVAAAIATSPHQPQVGFLTIVAMVRDEPTTIILRGPWPALSELRQAILKGRMQAAKQWHT